MSSSAPIQPQHRDKGNWIPEVSKALIQERAYRIKPVVRFRRRGGEWVHSVEGKLHYIEPVDLFHTSFIWDPKPTTRASGLAPLGVTRTYHTYGYHGIFKPSIAEVLAQIPPEFLDRVVAFEIIDQPQTTDDLNRERVALDAGYHVATTRLYHRRK